MEEYIVETTDGRFRCTLCQDFSSDKRWYVKRHVDSHKKGDGEILCNKGCTKNNKGHYHCSCGCKKTFDRLSRYRNHLDKQNKLKVSSITDVTNKKANNITDATNKSVNQNEENSSVTTNARKVNCPECNQQMWKNNLKEHIRRRHKEKDLNEKSSHSHQGTCVDRNNGIFLISETRSGVQYPIHVQKLIRGNSNPKIACESSQCNANLSIASISGNPVYECPHLESVNSITLDKEEVLLHEETLETLVDEKRMNEDTKKLCIAKQKEVKSRGATLVDAMCDDRWVFLSVFSLHKKWYSRLGRVVVSFDKKNFKLVCKCSGSARISCEHKHIAKWYLRTFFPDSFLPVQSQDNCVLLKHFPPEVEYVYSHKKITCPLVTPKEQFSEENFVITPSETKCCLKECGGELLCHESYENAKLLTHSGFISICRVWTKKCKKCSLVVSYNDTDEGIFNFNNKLFVSMNMILYLQIALREHVPISKHLIITEKLYNINIDHQKVRKALYKYLALISDDNNFRCYICGYHPVILTFDVSRKVAFKMGKDQCLVGQYDGKVNTKVFWDNVNKCVIEGNPEKYIKPSLYDWAPYIPEFSRKSDEILNTEHLKGNDANDEQEFLECLTEESLEKLLDLADVQNLRSLCQECGIENTSQLSRNRCIQKLIDALQNHTKIDKFFVKIWHSSGGLLTASCPHGCIYCLKFLVRPESPRDIGDILLSLAHPPNIVISDIPHMVAAHVNKREGRNFFNPYCGRVVEASDENIRLAEANALMVSKEWINLRDSKAKSGLNICGTDIHPLTMVTQRLSLCDRFHEGNTKQKKEFLRKTGQVKELLEINTETAEQVNSFLSKSLSFIDCMSPIHHLLVVKSMLSLRNMEINSKILGNRKPFFDIYGRLIESSSSTVGPSNTEQRKPLKRSIQNDSMIDKSNSTTATNTDVFLKHKIQRVEEIVEDNVDFFAERYDPTHQNFNEFVKVLFKGISNISRSCWINSVIVAVRNVIGSSRLFEDLAMNLYQDYLSDPDLFTSVLAPLFESVGISNSRSLVDKSVIKQHLQQYFNGPDLAVHEDPLNFFLTSTSLIDWINKDDYLYQITLETNSVCLNCSDKSRVVSHEGCLSISPEIDVATDVKDLLLKYFEDELIEDKHCIKCNASVAVLTKKITNIPKVLSVHLKRYDNNLMKSTDIVKPNYCLDLKEIMIPNDSSYTIRAVIAHKGATRESGHYTTTIIENVDSNYLFFEIDDDETKIFPSEVDHLNKDGYIFIYEHQSFNEKLLQTWFNLTLTSLVLSRCSDLENATLLFSFDKIWKMLDTSSITYAEKMLKVLANKLGRCFTVEETQNFPFLLKLLKLPNFISYFAGLCHCAFCDTRKMYIINYDILHCELNQQSVLDHVSDGFSFQTCVICENEVKLISTPKIVSRTLVIETSNIVTRFENCKEIELPTFVQDFGIVGGYLLGSEESFIIKDESIVKSVGLCLKKVRSIKEKSIAFVQGFKSVKSRDIEVTHKQSSVEYFTSDNSSFKHKKQLEACLQNITDDDDICIIAQKLLKHNSIDSVVVREVLCKKLFENAAIIYFHSEKEFLCSEIGLIASKLCISNSCYIILNFGESMVVLQTNNDVFKVYLVGSRMELVEKIIEACTIVFSSSRNYEIVNILMDFTKFNSFIQSLKLVHCIINQIDLIIEADVWSVVVTMFLGLPPFGTRLFEEKLKEKCYCYDIVPIGTSEYREFYLVAKDGALFSHQVKASLILQEVKSVFQEYCSDNLEDDTFWGMLNFVMDKKKMIKDLYLLKMCEDTQRMISLLQSDVFNKSSNRIQFLLLHQEKMLKSFPAHLYFTVLSILNVTLRDRNGPQGYVYNSILKYGSFSMQDFIQLFLTKYVLVQYVIENLCLSSKDLLMNVGTIGENLFND